jgi:hypothetical protein
VSRRTRPRPGALGLLIAAAVAVATRGGLPAAHAAQHPRARASVVGGSPADPQVAPWVVAVLTTRGGGSIYARQQCAGTLLGPRLVLTAAHCAFTDTRRPRRPADLRVFAGAILPRRGGLERRVVRITVEPRFRSSDRRAARRRRCGAARIPAPAGS